MRQRKLSMFLGFVFAVGCGGETGKPGAGGSGGAGSEDTAGAQAEELAYESDMAVDEVNAAVDLVEGETQLAATAAPGEADPKGAALQSRDRIVRSDLARILRQMARERALPPCDPPPRLEKRTAMAGCQYIGRMGEYVSNVSLTFNACTLASGTRLDGTIELGAEKKLVEGEACRLGAPVDVSYDATVNLTVTVPDGGRAETRGTASAHLVRGIGVAPNREIRLDEERKRLRPDGRVVLDQHLVGTAMSAFELTTVPALVTSATFTAELRLAGVTASSTAEGIRRVRGCCHPVGGTWNATLSGNATFSKTVEFGPECGQVTVDGTPARLPMCF